MLLIPGCYDDQDEMNILTADDNTNHAEGNKNPTITVKNVHQKIAATPATSGLTGIDLWNFRNMSIER
ncbi:hypothetical protein FE236_09305 [Mariprofundus erugo]|uniref:Uncharacterized protein n=1 Tax=Mariprofundus erugo TaxID=2528639 RepID=A0A5R9GUG0_9PROT|nr:hypothetical protein [Mariprofundus erugo]TLS67662.1 hypothetical protein FEF65_07035 [Mariprofundus erugo]TLS75634.1 hypothetical protein FE236_09305 [Mariprofundus erugo]